MTLSTGDLEYMEDSIAELLPDTCEILTKTSVPDGHGGVTVTWATSSTVSCRVDFTNGMTTLAGGALQPFVRMDLTLPHDTVINGENQVRWNGGVYKIDPPTIQSWLTYKMAVIHG